MNLKKSGELLLIIKNNTETIFMKTKTRATESVGLKEIRSIESFYSDPNLLLQEEIYLIAVTKNEVRTSYFIITDQNKTFAIYKLGYWQDPDTNKTCKR